FDAYLAQLTCNGIGNRDPSSIGGGFIFQADSRLWAIHAIRIFKPSLFQSLDCQLDIMVSFWQLLIKKRVSGRQNRAGEDGIAPQNIVNDGLSIDGVSNGCP